MSSPLSPGQLPLDESWFHRINSLARTVPWLDTPGRLYAEYGVVLFAAFLLASWWLARRRADPHAMAAALWAPLGVLLAVAVNQPIGNAFAEARPYDTLPHVAVLVSRTSDFSFPSDHAVMAGAVAAGVFLVHRRLGLAAWAAAVLMCLARVFVGAHYPIDVAAGLLVGAVVTLTAFLVVGPLLVRLVTRASATRLRPALASSSPSTRSATTTPSETGIALTSAGTR